jgi:hypothetical protein
MKQPPFAVGNDANEDIIIVVFITLQATFLLFIFAGVLV